MVEGSEIGAKLKAYFDSIGLTQKQVATKLGVSQATINQLLSGKSSFGKNTAQKWHDAFGFNKGFLITGEGEMFGDGVVQNINGNSGVAIQQVGQNTSSSSKDDNVFVRMCADLMKQIMDRDHTICCLEEENRKLKEQLNKTNETK